MMPSRLPVAPGKWVLLEILSKDVGVSVCNTSVPISLSLCSTWSLLLVIVNVCVPPCCLNM